MRSTRVPAHVYKTPARRTRFKYLSGRIVSLVTAHKATKPSWGVHHVSGIYVGGGEHIYIYVH